MNPATTSSVSRRAFVRHTACGVAAVALQRILPRVAAATLSPSAANALGPRALVLIHLEGGNDGWNTVVPFRDDRYYRLRPTLALAPRELVVLNDTSALHRAAAALEPLFKDGKLAVVQNVGYSRPSPSHFRSSEIWQTASVPEARIYSGWVGRGLADLQTRGQAVAGFYATPSLPRVFAMEADRIGGPGSAPTSCRAPLNPGIRDPLEALAAIGECAGATPATEIYFVSVPGFDTHFDQAQRHAARLKSFSDALLSFQRRLEKRGVDRRVLTMAFSEFGRSTAENAQGGTEHGAGGPVFLLGGGMGGGVFNESARLPDAMDPSLLDFRRIIGSIGRRWLDVSPSALFARDPGTVDFLRVPATS